MPMGRNRPVPNHRSTSQPMPPQATTPDTRSPMMVQATSDPPGPSRPLLPGADPMGWANIPEGTGVGWVNARAGDNERDQPVRGDPDVRSPSGALAPISAQLYRPCGQVKSKRSRRPAHQGTVVAAGRCCRQVCLVIVRRNCVGMVRQHLVGRATDAAAPTGVGAVVAVMVVSRG